VYIISSTLIFVFVSNCICLCPGQQCKTEWQQDDMLNPRYDMNGCGRCRRNSSWICDPCNVLNNEIGNVLE
jgi:hypothetical protein